MKRWIAGRRLCLVPLLLLAFAAAPEAAAQTLSINSPSVTEGNSGSTNLTFTVTLSAASAQQVTVDYADARTGTATSGTDYTAITGGTLTFTAGTTSQTFTVAVTGDTTDEANETVVVTLSSATNATISTATGTGTITNDDVTPGARWTPGGVWTHDVTTTSLIGKLMLQQSVTITGGSRIWDNVAIDACPWTTVTPPLPSTSCQSLKSYGAIPGSPFRNRPLTVTNFAPTQAMIDNGGVVIRLRWQGYNSPAGGNVGMTEWVPLVPPPNAALVLMPASISENAGVSTVTATLDRTTSAATTITVSAAAVAPAVSGDFTLTGTTLTIPAGTTTSTGTVTLTAVDNAIDAADKAVTVSGTASDSVTNAPPDVTLTITDDDRAGAVAPPGGGTPPPPPNRAPVAVGEFGDLDLDPGRSAEVPLSGRFRDPEGGALGYSAESLNPEVARAAVSGGRLWVDGRSPGLATVVVTATDSGGLSARLSFSVAVGRVLSFSAASASAPEGGAARLRVELSRPSERAVSAGYVLEADGDPGTADADAADHGGSDGTLTLAAGESEAFIEVPINDDMDIEPAREHLRVRLLAPDSEADWALGAATASVAIEEGVCDRTPEVRDALRGSRECRAPSVRELAERGYLSLYRRGIGSLREGDLLGLAGLRVLHLHGNGLAELPAGLFAGLGALERLRLDGNRLAELQEGLFAGLGRLSSLDLGGNRLRSLPGGLLSDLASLSRLDLGGNRLAELPAGFFKGASNLSELNLSGNPGAPFTLAMELVRTDAEDFAPGPAAVVARVAEGAPFALSAGLLAEGAALSADSARIGAGQVSGAPIAVSLSEGGAARLSLSGAPEVPSGLCGDVQDGRHPCFRGVRTEAGPGLLLFKRPPRVVRAVPGQAVESLGGALALDLSEFLAADGGGALAYSAESSDPALASVSVSGGVLSIEPNGEGLEGLVTVTVTATDSDGLAVEHRFTVAVSAAARPFARGWRLGWMAGAPAPAAEAAPPGAEPQ